MQVYTQFDFQYFPSTIQHRVRFLLVPNKFTFEMLRAKPTKLEVTRIDIEELDFFRKRLADEKDQEEARLELEAAEKKSKSGRGRVTKKDNVSSR